MLNNLFSAIYTDTFTIQTYLICTAVSLVLGGLIAFTANFRAKQSKSFLLALFLIPAIVQTVIMLVNGSVGTGVAVMGAFSLVRFRSVAGSAKEIVSIFLAMATGLATAMGYIGLAIVIVSILCIAMIIASFIRLKEKDDLVRELKITVPEDLNYAHSFDDVFEKYTKTYKLQNVKTTNMGSLYKLSYNIELKSEDDIQDFINDLRCRNGNLEISVMIPAVPEVTL
ncbi:DUF4956 domain-containing protein [Ruminococcus sp. JL13D9]|uniref:DUF4956 domain-containing protein n=1 Tax=Ruminococcus sp. JL13D9 TaxID=3233381 RepID=UPI00389A6337